MNMQLNEHYVNYESFTVTQSIDYTLINYDEYLFMISEEFLYTLYTC
ncbi:hypothetical protein [Bacillus taeanensis]|nr:hypothetical protein [Bacillus taeanensis]